MDNPLANDLDHILAHTEGLWDELRGQRLFVTGGTGFLGCWMLESFAWANDKLGLGARALVLTRNPETFRHKAPHLAAHSAIQFHVGDIRSFEFPSGSFSHIIHAATDYSTRLIDEDPILVLDTIVQGTRRTLEFARSCGAREFLLTSSGAVYGKQPPDMTHIPEDHLGALDTMESRSGYGEGKRVAELLCTLYAKQYGIETKIARGFAFVGPYLPLDAHFAIGNFIGDGLRNRPIQVKGDGTPYRSYLYAADLAIWLWTILCCGEVNRPYNIGSEIDVTISDLSHAVAELFKPKVEVCTAKKAIPGGSAQRYVPCTQRARVELGLRQNIDLSEAIRRTVCFEKRRLGL